MSAGVITKISDISLFDGEGKRTFVYFKGCPLRCRWCDSPETQRSSPQISFDGGLCIACGACLKVCPGAADGNTAVFSDICKDCGACAHECPTDAYKLIGYEITAHKLFTQLIHDTDIYRTPGAGITFSGGEPLMQKAFLHELCNLFYDKGIDIAIESSLFADYSAIEPLLPLVNHWYCDIKAYNGSAHIAATGVYNRVILDNVRKLSAAGVNMTLRTPIIPGFNDVEELAAIKRFIASLPYRHEHELLPLQTECKSKYAVLGIEFNPYITDDDDSEQAEKKYN